MKPAVWLEGGPACWWPSSLCLHTTATLLCNSNQPLLKNKWCSRQLSKFCILRARIILSHFQKSVYKPERLVSNGTAWQMGTRSILQASWVTGSKSCCFAGPRVCGENKINPPSTFTKAPFTADGCSTGVGGEANEVDAASWQEYWKMYIEKMKILCTKLAEQEAEWTISEHGNRAWLRVCSGQLWQDRIRAAEAA